ncbi:MAG: cupin [Sphingobium sp.]|nr:cupin [Sphingobium sp.]
MMETEDFILRERDWVPNNEWLPVLVYRAVFEGEGQATPERFEQLFADHGWPPQWRDTIYDYHHYHSTTHEALGIAAGSARLMLGGPLGRTVLVKAGDALVLPVGTGHCRLEASEDFLVVGAYPSGQDWDICRDAPSEEARGRMRDLPIPAQDPVCGREGPLIETWASADERA